MTEKEYITFFNLLQRIVDDESCRTWEDKKAKLLEYANEADEGNLEEIAGWF